MREERSSRAHMLLEHREIEPRSLMRVFTIMIFEINMMTPLSQGNQGILVQLHSE